MRIKNHFMYLLPILFICGFYRSVNATPITVTCSKWETDNVLTFTPFHKVCVLKRKIEGGKTSTYTNGKGEIVVSKPATEEYECHVGSRCTQWSVSIDYRALYKEMLDTVGRSNSLYSDVVYGIDQNSTDFRDRIIKMLDTVTLQKIYDPNLMSVNP